MPRACVSSRNRGGLPLHIHSPDWRWPSSLLGRSTSRRFWALAAGFCSFLLLIACTADNKPREKTRPATPVMVTAAIQKDVPVQLRVVAKVEAYSAVAVRAMVEGELWKVYFKEGQDVQKDSLLLSIDPRPFEAALRQAEANVERDQALA